MCHVGKMLPIVTGTILPFLENLMGKMTEFYHMVYFAERAKSKYSYRIFRKITKFYHAVFFQKISELRELGFFFHRSGAKTVILAERSVKTENSFCSREQNAFSVFTEFSLFSRVSNASRDPNPGFSLFLRVYPCLSGVWIPGCV